MRHRLIECVFNDAMRMVPGCLLHIPTDYLPRLAELRRQTENLFLAYCSVVDHKHLLHQQMVGLTIAHVERFQSRHPFRPAARI